MQEDKLQGEQKRKGMGWANWGAKETDVQNVRLKRAWQFQGILT